MNFIALVFILLFVVNVVVFTIAVWLCKGKTPEECSK
jgi:hypothetical protein